MAEIVYSTRRSGFEDGKIYRNPRYFRSPLASGIDRVIVDGDWPAVVAGYKALDVEVVQLDRLVAPVQSQVSENQDTPEQNEQTYLLAALKSRGINRDKRTSIEKLRELLAKEEAGEREALTTELAALGVEHGADLPLDELRALVVTAKNATGGQ